ncbi:Synembryn [Camponotus floridanus]|uniref:Synembryn n=1 Tax=Camponotus floridanus TaxID=104421 RepID=E2AEB1_CAMFO|nr:Synembryn [Camponotus floridanus]
MEKVNTDELISKLISGTYEEFCDSIVVFLEIYDKKTNFEELNNNCLREKLWKRLFYYLTDYTHLNHHHHCLAALRILSRDKTNLNDLITDEAIKIILQNAVLTKICEEDQISYTIVTIESLKLLCNLLFNSLKVQQSKVLISSLPYLIDRVKNYTTNVPYNVKLFDMRILFLLTALNISTRDIVKTDLCGDICLIKIINVVNLLTVIPSSCYTPIIQSVESDDCKNVYQNMDMSAICVLLRFLDQRLDYTKNLIENISPIVTALIRLVKSKRIIRKYVRLQILPPLKDVMNRPEEGTTLRAKLCKLLTSPLTELRDLVAELLFILCKENVSRMVKYTGYGNAAGMFAKKGLLAKSSQTETNYSSESEDSETEEYLKVKEQINPVTGCFESPKSNPLEGMTDVQKEYEALQLVNLVDKLTREGVVRPCRIGDDGKPKPIEHVLELQDELPKQQYGRKDSGSE